MILILATIVITFLVKNPVKSFDRKYQAKIHYCDIGDYLNRKQKLDIIKKYKSVANEQMQWQQIVPNAKEDWINQRDGLFETLILIGDKKDKNRKEKIFYEFSLGFATGQDVILTNYSKINLEKVIKSCIAYYESIRKNEKVLEQSKLNFNREIKNRIKRNLQIQFDDSKLCDYAYRPFSKYKIYNENLFISMNYQIKNFFPTPKHENLVICISGIGGTKDVTCLISNRVTDLNMLDAGTQCFPLYYYTEQKTERDGELFADVTSTENNPQI